MGCVDCFNILYYFVIPCLVCLFSQYLWKKFMHGTSEEKIPEHNEETRQASSPYLTEPSGDVVDYPTDIKLKTALDRVSEAIYTSYVAVWLKAPEEIKSQPLYKAINKAIFDIYDNAHKKAQHIDSCKIILIIINGLTKHLKTSRKGKAKATEKSRQDEVNLLRQQTQSLLACLLPDSLRDSIYLMPFLTETVAISVLETTINYMANPSFINQLIVSRFDNQPRGKQEHSTTTDETTQNEHYNLGTDSGISRAPAADSHRIKQRGPAEPSGAAFRSLPVVTEDSDVSDSSSVDTDSSDSLLDACREQWAKKDWTATISKLDNNSFEIEITINYAGLAAGWITERSMDDLVYLYTVLSEHVDLKEHQVSKTSEDDSSSTSDSNCIEIKSPKSFIETVVTEVKENLSAECMYFLSPFPYDEEARHLFTDTLSEEESEDGDAEHKLSSDGSSSDTARMVADGISEDDGARFRVLRKRGGKKKESKPSRSVENEGSLSPSPLASDGNNQPMIDYMRSNHSMDMSYDVVGQSFGPQKSEKQEKEKVENLKKVQVAVVDLADEITHTKIICNIATKLCVLNIKNRIATEMPGVRNKFSGTEVAKYLDLISGLIESPEAAPVPPLEPLRKETLKVIKQNQQRLLKESGWICIFFARLFGVNALPRVIHNAFQDIVANKETVFELLKDLVKLIIDEVQQTKQGSVSST